MDKQNKNNNGVMIFAGIVVAGALIAGAIVYTGQNKGTTSNTVVAGTLEEKLSAAAKNMGLKQKAFDACLAKKDDSEIKKDIADTQTIGIQGTPSFLVGRSTESGVIKGKIIGGAYPFSKFKELIDEALAGEVKEGKLVTADDIPNPTPQQLQMSEADYANLSDKDKEDLNKRYKDYIVTQTNAGNKLVEGSVDDDPVIGNKDAPVTIIDFSDFECPFCKRHFTDTYPQLKKEYIDTGKVKVVYRDMIAVPSHDPASTTEAIAANCAREQGGDEAYVKMHDYIYKNTKGNGQGL